MDVPDDLSGASPEPDERQPALPGLDDLEAPEMGSPDRALLVSAGMLHGVDVEKISSLHLRIAEMMSAAEVPIRALRNPGKVLGELAEKGEIARVTNHGKIVGWLVPATEAEQHLDALLKQGRLRRGTPAPIEPIDIEGLERPLSEALADARDGERT
jgi:antitoxin (DNA-binding transcriptional repressor) of toxin-antitoxin stability system